MKLYHLNLDFYPYVCQTGQRDILSLCNDIFSFPGEYAALSKKSLPKKSGNFLANLKILSPNRETDK